MLIIDYHFYYEGECMALLDGISDEDLKKLRFIAFIDILRFSNNVSSSYDNSLLRKNLEECLEHIKQSENINYNMGSIPSPSKDGMEYTMFSDSIVISIPVTALCGFLSLLESIAQLQMDIINCGFIVRGGISFGEHIHEKNKIIGKAMINAVNLEKIAVYPRIIISEEDVNYGIWVDVKCNKYASNSDCVEREMVMQWLKKSEDGFYFIDPFNNPIVSNYDLDAKMQYLRKIQKLVENSISNKSMEIRMKYAWLNRQIPTKFVIFGAGDFGRQALNKIGKENVAFFVDNDGEKEGTIVDGIPVHSFTNVKDKLNDYLLILAVSHKYSQEIGTQLKKAGIKVSDSLLSMRMRETKRKIEQRIDYLRIYSQAIRWVKEHTVKESIGLAVINNTGLNKGYPEVTGYYIPTLIRWGYRDLAVEYAKWLVSIQKEDGSWYDTLDHSPYVFDTGQILKGLLAVCNIYPEVDDAIKRGVTWILNNKQPSARLTTPDEGAWSSKRTCSELIHLYCLSPILQAAELFGRDDWKADVGDILNYYKTNHYDEIMNFGLLSHFYAYVMEALVDMGEFDMVKEAMEKIAQLQTKEGAVPGYHDVHWVCSTGLFQLALVWFRIGDLEHGNKAFTYACKLQNVTGGWYGSYPSEEDGDNDYFPGSEISWAVKYFLDALYYKNQAEFNESAPLFKKSIEKDDGRYQELLKNVKEFCPLGWDNRIIDVGCGKGRYLRNLLEDVPSNNFYGVDISKNVIEEKTENRIHWQEGSLTNIPYKDNSFDVAYACESLEHAVDIESAIREMARVVKPGGYIIIIDKNIEALGMMEIAEWEQWFSEKGLAEIMRLVCDDVRIVHDVDYEDHFQKNLFSVWTGMVKG